MKGNLLTFGCFAAGILIGLTGSVPEWMLHSALPSTLLSLLIFTVGIGLGSNSELHKIIRSFSPRMLWLPLFTIGGTLLFSALGTLLPGGRNLWECLSVGSGFGYYSLSSILIADLCQPTLGAQGAAELSTIALLANVTREMLALFCIPLFVRYFGRLAPISAAGINSMDVCLPRIVSATSNGTELIPLCILHGIVLEISVPILIQLFC